MTDETAAQHCVACGQVKRPDDYWQRKIGKAAEDALEQAAKVCDELRTKDYSSEDERWVAGTDDCAVAIRAMKECGK